MANLFDLQNIRVSKNFWLCELMPPTLFGNEGLIPRWFLTPFLAVVPQKLRDHFGKLVTINNWKAGGTLDERGLRMPNTKTGSVLSQHKMGNAIDINVAGLTDQEVLSEIKKFWSKWPEITTHEQLSDTPGWLHLDCRNIGPAHKTLYEANGK